MSHEGNDKVIDRERDQLPYKCVDDGTWVCDYCHNLWDKEYHPDFCDEDCPDYMETGKFCSIKIEGGE